MISILTSVLEQDCHLGVSQDSTTLTHIPSARPDLLPGTALYSTVLHYTPSTLILIVGFLYEL